MNSASDAFQPVRQALEEAGVRYAIGGSWAGTVFGEPRFTNDVDILAAFSPETLDRFLNALPPTVYADRDDAQAALKRASAFPLGEQELERAVLAARRSTANTSSEAPRH